MRSKAKVRVGRMALGSPPKLPRQGFFLEPTCTRQAKSGLQIFSRTSKTLALGHALKGQSARWAHGLRKSSEVAKATFFFEPICTGHAKSGLQIFSRNSKTLALGHFFQKQISFLTPGPGKKQILKKSRPFCSARPCCAATSFKFPHHR